MNIISHEITTMSSREIAELTGKRHDNVLADIRKMLAEIQSPEKLGDYKDGLGRAQPCLLLTKEESICLVAGYSAALRMAIIKRWQELEWQSKPQVPQTYAAALLEAGRLALEVERQAEQLAIAAPKVDFADRVASADKGVLIGNFAKSIGIGPRKIFDILRNEKILMAGGNRHNLPFQEYIDRGYFDVREGTFDNYGEIRISFTPLITGKGQQWLTIKLIEKGYLKAIVSN